MEVYAYTYLCSSACHPCSVLLSVRKRTHFFSDREEQLISKYSSEKKVLQRKLVSHIQANKGDAAT